MPCDALTANPERDVVRQHLAQLLQYAGNLTARKGRRERECDDIGLMRKRGAPDIAQGHLRAEWNAFGAFQCE